jgi:NTP pyrophosphatase (non-canonical NTP hydrolase)
MNILERAIETYGKDMQLNVAVEELSELIKEICKHKRGADNLENIVEEIADCYIMIEQLMLMLDINYSQVYNQMRLKIQRLEERLKEGG